MTEPRDHNEANAFETSWRLVGSEPPLVSRALEAREVEELERRVNRNHMETETFRSLEEARDGALPFIGRVLSYAPGSALAVERRLSLEEDLYLADHAFVHAPGVKPMSACLPILPMTMSLEAMAEAAACLAPGNGLLGFEDVKATRWIELADVDAATIEITANLIRYDRDTGVHRIGAAIAATGQTSPAITATVLFGNRYQAELVPSFGALANPRRFARNADQIYAERHMFHGPSFQCLVGDIIVGEAGVRGELLVRPSDRLFRSTPRPQLLACPTLLDSIGQIIGVWALEHDRFVFPIGLQKLEIYRQTPPAGTRVPVRVEITKNEGKTLSSNVEVGDGSGGVWMRAVDWQGWKFRWAQRLVDFRRLPTQFLLAQKAPPFERDADSVCLTLSFADLEGFDFALLARYCLNDGEMRRFKDLSRFPERQRQWLLGRVVAKDAARSWLAGQARSAMAHPAALAIDVDENGSPIVAETCGFAAPPHLSLAHCEDRAVAAAQAQKVGVDLERVARRDAAFVDTIATAKERQLLEPFSRSARDEWITRLWCAKEAVGKLLGVGIVGLPQSLEASRIERTGEICIRHRASARSYAVSTLRDADFVVAYATQSRPAADHAGSTHAERKRDRGT
jgi:phosphopantetheinyl transferase